MFLLLLFSPVTTVSPEAYYWGINITDLLYGSKSIMASQPCIVDTGTTLIYVSNSTFTQYQAEIGALFDPDAGLYWITSETYEVLHPMYLTIGGVPEVTLEITSNAQIFPVSPVVLHTL